MREKLLLKNSTVVRSKSLFKRPIFCVGLSTSHSGALSDQKDIFNRQYWAGGLFEQSPPASDLPWPTQLKGPPADVLPMPTKLL